MRKFLFIILAFFIVKSSLAFNEEDTRVRMRSQDLLVFDFFIDFWDNVPDDMGLNFFNRGFNYAYMHDIPIGFSRFAVAPGLGFTSHNMYSDNWYKYSDGKYNFEPIYDDFYYDKNKININYINIPVELRYRIMPSEKMKNTFRMAIGARLGYMIQAHTKYEGDYYVNNESEDIRDVKFKEHNLNNIEDWQYGIMGRIGYGDSINLMVYYPLNDIFKENKSEDFNLISFGVSFVLL